MTDVVGVIDSIYTKDVTTKFGTKEVYHAMINGQDINLGFKCAYVVGESVTLPVEHKYGSLQLIQGGNGAAPAATGIKAAPVQAQATAPQQAATEFPVAQGTRGITIARQNSGGHAATIVAALIAQGKITTPEAALDEFMELAYEIADFATGHREIKMALDQDSDE